MGKTTGLCTFKLSDLGQSPLWGICVLDHICNEISSSAGMPHAECQWMCKNCIITAEGPHGEQLASCNSHAISVGEVSISVHDVRFISV